MSARAVFVTAGYVLIVESLLAALGSLLLAAPLDASFANAGGFLAAAGAPGAPLLVEGALPLVFGAPFRWLGALLLLAVGHALVAPLVQLTWLAGLHSGASSLPAALVRAVTLLGAAVRLRLLLWVPAALGLGTVVIAVVYAQLVFRGTSERAADVAALVALGLGLVSLTPLRVLGDLGQAALVHAASESDEAFPPRAGAALGAALRAWSVGAYVRWALATVSGVLALLGATVLTGTLDDPVAVVVVVLATFVRYALRSAWLAAALGSLPRRRLGSTTQKLAPPAPSSAFSAEILPP